MRAVRRDWCVRSSSFATEVDPCWIFNHVLEYLVASQLLLSSSAEPLFITSEAKLAIDNLDFALKQFIGLIILIARQNCQSSKVSLW
jgi:hypothetical protein